MEKEFNYKLEKRKRRFITYGLIPALVLGGYFSIKSNNNVYPHKDFNSKDSIIQTNDNIQSTKNDYNYSFYDDNIAFEIKKGEDDFVVKNDLPKKINLDTVSVNKFNHYINSLNNDYFVSDLYGIEKLNSKYVYVDRDIVHSHDITNGSGVLTEDMLYNRVIENNKKFLSDSNNSGYLKLNKKLLHKSIKLIVECINNQIKDNPDLDKKELFCILYDLKIVGKCVTFDNAFYSEDDVLVIDEKNIERFQFFNKEIDAFRQVIYHETMHIIQSHCKDREKQNEVSLGICTQYDDLEINPLYWSWFIEASAEKEMAKVLNESPSTYLAPIGYYDSVVLCSILNDNIDVKDVEQICFDKNLNDFFKIFNAKTDAEKLEIIKMMYSIEVMQFVPDEFATIYKTKTGIDIKKDEEELEKLRLKLRVEILNTLTKNFYKSLTNHISKNKIDLNTIFYMINIYESDVYIHLFFNQKDRIASGVEFFDFYTDIQNNFFNMLSNSLNISYDDIVNQFNEYSMNIIYNNQKTKNYNLTSFGEMDAKFIESKKLQNYQTGIPNIRSMPKYCIDNGFKK